MDDREKLFIDRVFSLEQEYYRNIRPYVKMKTDIYNLTIPVIIIRSEGVERTYNFTPEQGKALEQIDEAIGYIQEQIKKSVEEARSLYRI